MKNGQISVKAENMLPIIKKWLYSDKDIFLREAVSNASDAIFKFERLAAIGEAEKADGEKYGITVSVDKEKKTLTISDNGLGMTEDEVVNYIAQVAFSGAVDFMEKYKEQAKNDQNGIIGHFGLGFYSVFMVSDVVEIDTLSYKKDAVPVKWVCDGGSEYQIGEGARTTRGTTVTLHIAQDSEEFLDAVKVREVLKKYCSFLSYEITLTDENKEKKDEGDDKPVNNVAPLWLKNPKDCTDEEYKQFYKDVFHDYMDPLFWIHLNVDYPFQLKAIIYFPKLRENVDLMDLGEIKLYYNQVFVADNIKEILPEFLMVLRGVIDCPDIPINVSRSFLQNDGSVVKISNLIAKKISDKLHTIFKDSRDAYAKYWDDIHVLIKYGCIRDSKFFDRMKDALIFKSVDGAYKTVDEYFGTPAAGEGAEAESKETGKEKRTMYYTDNKAQQSVNIDLFKKGGIDVVELSHPIDMRFTQELEMREQGLRFASVVSELPENLVSDKTANEDDVKALTEIFKTAIGKEKLEVKVEYLKNESTPALLTMTEESRRMAEMSKTFGFDMGFKPDEGYVITVNRDHPLIGKIMDMRFDEAKKESMTMLCQQIYDISLMSHRALEKEEKEKFIERNYKLLEMI